MKAYIVRIRVEIDDEDIEELGEQQIRDLFYDAGGEMPFGFDVTQVAETS